MGVKYSCYNKCHIICIFNPIDSLWPYICPALGVRVPRALMRCARVCFANTKMTFDTNDSCGSVTFVPHAKYSNRLAYKLD